MTKIDTKSIFYHIFPLGACGCPKHNDFVSAPESRILQITEHLDRIQRLGCNAVLLGPVFESSTHGYDTANYDEVDRRLGSNADLAELSKEIHKRGMALVLDGVFNHVGRNFWAFKDVQNHGVHSAYKDWFSGLKFEGQSPYGDPFQYDCWQGYYELVKLNLYWPEVRAHLFEAVRMWKEVFQVDGLRLDAADALNKEFIKALRGFCGELDADFWLMGELIHGDYREWVNPEMAHASTAYELYKSAWSSFNEHNFFELSYSLNRQFGEGGIYRNLTTQYNFVDNHDLSRIASILKNPKNLEALHLLLFCEPGIPSIYYGSEFALQANKTQNDWELRPAFALEQWCEDENGQALCPSITKFSALRQRLPALQNGEYCTRFSSLGQLAFTRSSLEQVVLIALNNMEESAAIKVPMQNMAGWKFRNALDETKDCFVGTEGWLELKLEPNEGQIWVSSY
ncbi:MAG: alpha-amylase family glycosyl hydrolase [Anaerolineaceae bacterium]|nr:alpha-amylase family glycosyl hydrolase [Anaerolineaceae bacterium]